MRHPVGGEIGRCVEGTNVTEDRVRADEGSDEGGDRSLSITEFRTRVRREATRDWIFLLGSALLVIVATLAIVAMAMR
jgi:hypothetical protein